MPHSSQNQRRRRPPMAGVPVLILSAGVFWSIAAPGAASSSGTDALGLALLPWWLLGLVLMVLGLGIQYAAAMPVQPLNRSAIERLPSSHVAGSMGDDLTTPVRRPCRAPAAVRAHLDDLTIPAARTNHLGVARAS